MEYYEIIRPSKELQPFVRHYWILKVKAEGNSGQRTVPTGCISLIFHRGARLYAARRNEMQPRSFVCGQETGYSEVIATGDTEMIAVVFRPHTAKTFLGQPALLFRDLNVSMEEVGDRELRDLAMRIEDAADSRMCIAMIERFLMKKIMVNCPVYLPRLTEIIRLVDSCAVISPKSLQDAACLSEKQFGRVFADHVGVSAKEFVRIIRIQRALAILQQRPTTGFAALAYQCGFADQSHMIKEFKKYCGNTPKEFLLRYNPISDYFCF